MKGGKKYAAEFIGTFALVFAGTGDRDRRDRVPVRSKRLLFCSCS